MSRAAARQIEDVAAYGPAMAALRDDRHRDFVTAFVLNGGHGATAARKAGFSDSGGGCKVRAHTLLRRDDIQAAVSEVSRIVLRAGAPRAVARLNQIIDSGKDADALRGISEVLARVDPVTTGHVVAVSHSHEHRHRVTLSTDEITRQCMELASRVGVDIARLPPMIDAVAVEVSE